MPGRGVLLHQLDADQAHEIAVGLAGMETRQPRYLLEGRRTPGRHQRAQDRASDLNRLNPQAFFVFDHQPPAALSALLSPSVRDNASRVDITICIIYLTIHNAAIR